MQLLFLLNCINFIYIAFSISTSSAILEEGHWTTHFTYSNRIESFHKSMYHGSYIKIKVKCSPHSSDINLSWTIRYSPCVNEYTSLNNDHAKQYLLDSDRLNRVQEYYHAVSYRESGKQPASIKCSSGESIILQNDGSPIIFANLEDNKINKTRMSQPPGTIQKDKFSGIWKDGMYLVVLQTSCPPENLRCNYSISFTVDMRGDYGYLSAVDYPLYPLYGACMIVYALLSIFWLIYSIRFWSGILSIQIWMGVLILICLIEKVVFFLVYYWINQNGNKFLAGLVIAELISCSKRTLARLLIMMVCIGYGILVPELTKITWIKVISITSIYGVLNILNSILLVIESRFQRSYLLMISILPMLVTDTIIAWWMYLYLRQTLNMVKVQQNPLKHNLYWHFRNLLIFAVIASSAFMIWSIVNRRTGACIKSWETLWLDDGFWYVLFIILFTVVLWLWRPSVDNHRYLYTSVPDSEGGGDIMLNEQYLSDEFDIES